MPRALQDSLQPNVLAAGAPAGISLRMWITVPLTGIAAGTAAGLLMLLLHAIQHLVWHLGADGFLSAVERTPPLWRIGILLSAGALAGIVRFTVKGSKGGGHAGEVAEAIWFKCGEMPVLQTLSKAILSVVIVGMGASLGREASAKQTGALIAGLLGRWAHLAPAEKRLMAACGTGAGLAAVYNLPFAGALFSLEILLGNLSLPLIPPALATSLIATWISWLFLPNAPTYHIPEYGVGGAQIVWSALAGPVIGVAAIVYIRAIAWADAVRPSGWPQLVAPIAVFSLLGIASVQYPQLLGNGKDMVQLAFLGQAGILVLVPLLFLKPLATSACLASGAPGGLFTPTLTCGALLGSILGWAWNSVLGTAALGSYAVIGAGAFLAAAMQAPLAAFVMILELTHSGQTLLLPAMFATASAAVISRRLEGRSIYSARIHKGLDIKRPAQGLAGTGFPELASDNYAIISTAARYTETLKEAIEAQHKGQTLYVLDEKRRLAGIISKTFVSYRPTSLELAIGTARDFAQESPFLSRLDNRQEAERKLKAGKQHSLPVADPESCVFLGAAALR